MSFNDNTIQVKNTATLSLPSNTIFQREKSDIADELQMAPYSVQKKEK